jgi:hypothetical protein
MGKARSRASANDTVMQEPNPIFATAAADFVRRGIAHNLADFRIALGNPEPEDPGLRAVLGDLEIEAAAVGIDAWPLFSRHPER